MSDYPIFALTQISRKKFCEHEEEQIYECPLCKIKQLEQALDDIHDYLEYCMGMKIDHMLMQKIEAIAKQTRGKDGS